MKQTGKCPKCTSTDLIVDAKVIDRGDVNREYDLSLTTFALPGAWIFKDKRQTKVSAWVCAACGFVELYATDPTAIKLPPA